MRQATLVVSLLLVAVTSASAAPSQHTLSFDDRVKAQKAIEQVYWSHRTWPAGNPAPKPRLSDVLPDEAIRRRVEDYSRKANALARIWGRPITADQLQAELERMTKSSRDPSTLRELFAALGNDPDLITGTLVTQTLADRLIHDWFAYDDRFHGEVRRKAESELAVCHEAWCMRSLSGDYREMKWTRDRGLDVEAWTTLRRRSAAVPVRSVGRLEEHADSFSVTAVLSMTDAEITAATVSWPKVSFDAWWKAKAASEPTTLPATVGTYSIPELRTSACVADTWRPTIVLPEERHIHTAVWTGSEMIVWGGFNVVWLNSGGRYTPATDSWVPTSIAAGTPSARAFHTAVWTGTEMIIWGGESADYEAFATGARYDPISDSWTSTSAGLGTPEPRVGHTAVWTGTRMIVWGGNTGGFAGPLLGTGGRYDPSTDSWSATSTALGAPAPRELHTAVWTGTRMIVWGGRGDINGDSFHGMSTGGRYDPATDTWAPTSTGPGVPDRRCGHSAVWTGNKMIIWGGTGYTSEIVSGGRYDPVSDSWIPMSTAPGVPAARVYHTAIWTGHEMIVWGGSGLNAVDLRTGGRYNPLTDTWTATSLGPNAPDARISHTAVWTGSEMIVWGGRAKQGPTFLDTGGRYDPISDSWLATSRGADAPVARSLHSAVWTGSEMVVWGGGSGTAYLTSGGRYRPSTDSWMPTSVGANVPEGRVRHTAVWTGTEMIVWGGSGLYDVRLASGGRYDPVTDAWVATATVNAPAGRELHTAVWTGTEMVVWGGSGGSGDVNTGGRYSPSSDSWLPTSTGPGVPLERQHHTAVWTGTEMIVWGGYGSQTGGRYHPSSDSWLPTSTALDVPEARWGHTAIWSGSEMIVWGGYRAGTGDQLDSGARYDPTTDLWAPMPAGAPSARTLHTAVWTGSEMVVWGGLAGSSYPVSGGRFAPATSQWSPTPTGDGVPLGRLYHSVVWTGAEMIVWGGNGSSTGGAYCACPNGRTIYRDADGDGYGDPGVPLPSCDGAPPAGYVVDHTDCDDVNPAVHPGQAEVCNGIDDSCAGTVDPGGDTLCNDVNACTGDLCDPSSGCVNGVANLDPSGFSASRIDGRDLVLLADAWNTCPNDPAYLAAADLDQVPCIDVTDFHLFMTTFGQSCP